jgi:hypothetical protein
MTVDSLLAGWRTEDAAGQVAEQAHGSDVRLAF